ncbi:MAG TPA: PTS IIA-like nitrogen regulatory protein PtsN [Caulobacteraceae bacterium]|jgi:PTS system nitrogen regulatory IIA component|nr:PTS IIA-like nitrogen regulatory protein PtsN [Caulobacteraceae bacterium]
MGIEELLDRRAITPKLAARSKQQALSLLAETAARRFGLDAGVVHDALLARERAGSTGVGGGVALPHARLEGLTRMRGVFVRLETPVAFDAVDDAPVDLIFALFAPKDAGAEHLRALARVARLLRDKELRGQLRRARTSDAIHAILAQPAHPSAA